MQVGSVCVGDLGGSCWFETSVKVGRVEERKRRKGDQYRNLYMSPEGIKKGMRGSSVKVM